MNGLPTQLREVARLQSGMVTASQLISGGLSWDFLRSRVDLGHWQRLYRGVYATFSGEPSRGAQLWAAVCACGPGAMLSHWAAAELARLSDSGGRLIDITIPSTRRIARHAGIVLHYSARASEAVHPTRLPPQTRVEETVLDLADAATTLDDAVAWVTRGLGRRLTTAEKLRAATELRAKMRWRPELAELLSPDAAGVHSPLEWRYHRDVERPHGLPAGQGQARYRRGSHNEYRDRLYQQYLIAVELDGRVAHPGDTRWDDIRRDNAAATGGILTLRYGWLDVTARPCLVAAEVVQALTSRGFTGARPCSATCPVGLVMPQHRSPA
jgi:hypothetical protein